MDQLSQDPNQNMSHHIWVTVYKARIESGAGLIYAQTQADDAVKIYRDRWGLSIPVDQGAAEIA